MTPETLDTRAALLADMDPIASLIMGFLAALVVDEGVAVTERLDTLPSDPKVISGFITLVFILGKSPKILLLDFEGSSTTDLTLILLEIRWVSTVLFLDSSGTGLDILIASTGVLTAYNLPGSLESNALTGLSMA